MAFRIFGLFVSIAALIVGIVQTSQGADDGVGWLAAGIALVIIFIILIIVKAFQDR